MSTNTRFALLDVGILIPSSNSEISLFGEIGG
jgi:hypothetical protein